MNPDKQQPSSPRRDQAPRAKEPARARETPNTDMQPEDAGTPESGAGGLANAAEGAMKQTSKTREQTGSKR